MSQSEGILRKVAEQFFVQAGERLRGVMPSGGFRALALELVVDGALAPRFVADMGDRQSLLARQVSIGGKVLLARPLDVARTGVLALDAFGGDTNSC